MRTVLTTRANGRYAGLWIGALALLASATASAQVPRINTLFPIGGRAGSTVEVEMRGASLDGANVVLVDSKGLSGTVAPGGAKVDQTFKPLWQAKCGNCHELRSPANRSMTAAQWAATVDRMVKVRQAPISPADQDKITQYLTSAARAGKLTAQIKIAPDTLPGVYELRVVTARGISTACPFEVGNLPEVMAANGTPETAQAVTLPCVANGSLSGNAERHYFKFSAKNGQRLVFDLKGFRYNMLSQMYFNPDLRLLDATGKELVENHGYYDLDPLIDWTCPADGEFILEVSDLLGRGNPGSVYRLRMGAVPYDTILYPPAAQEGSQVAETVIGKNTGGQPTSYTFTAPKQAGLTKVGSPFGPQPFYACLFPVVREEAMPAGPIELPAGFTGRIDRAGKVDRFPVQGEGNVEFEAYTQRLGSLANLRISLLNPAGKGMANMPGDGHLTAKLEAGKTYTLMVEEASGQSSPEDVFFVEAHPAHPVLECVARPANVTLRPGLATAVEVLLTRREGVNSDVTVTAEDLPPGVTATPAVIQPDRNTAWLVLTAAPNAQTVEKPFTIHASGQGPLGQGDAHAMPQEIFLLNNNPTPVDRTECVVAVCGDPEFTAALELNGPLKVFPRQGTPVKVKISRKPTFKGPVTVQIEGLPSGWVANPETIPPNKDEVTMLVRPDGNNTQPFLNRDPKMTPIRATVIATAEEFDFVAGTFPVTN